MTDLDAARQRAEAALLPPRPEMPTEDFASRVGAHSMAMHVWERLEAAEAELAALKGRRCETCKYWSQYARQTVPTPFPTQTCDYPETDDAKMFGAGWIETHKDFGCAAHEPREEVKDA
jgi:hypothetical protein